LLSSIEDVRHDVFEFFDEFMSKSLFTVIGEVLLGALYLLLLFLLDFDILLLGLTTKSILVEDVFDWFFSN